MAVSRETKPTYQNSFQPYQAYMATGGFANVNATNATTVNINSYSNAGTTLNDNVITLFCFGPR